MRRPTKCFKCWHFGHLSLKCKSEIDRTKYCIKCGEDGHKIAKCTKDARCALCTEKGKEDNCDHIAGSSRCAAFKVALQALTTKRR
ncbi:gag-pol polyprotein [Lasius niger]|uniref:Gag-pol polyprotein n=1 Tax=Lasius niger TaxID=67767 RepID=A0A0J7KGN7_LASNI|nr:gag-pol polyprotein [Lasius niger]